MVESRSLVGKMKDIVNYKMDDWLIKAKTGLKDNYVFRRKTIYTDEALNLDQGVFQEKGTLISFDILRQIAERDMIIAAVINKIVNRVAAFSKPQKDRYSLGYIIRPRDREKEIQDMEKKEIEEIEKFFNDTGYVTEWRSKKDCRNFDTFLRLITRDSLIYNQIAIECISSKDGNLSYFVPVSGGSIRFAVKDLKNKIKDLKGMMWNIEQTAERQEVLDETQIQIDKIKYVQVYKGQILAAYTDEDLIYKQRVPTTEIVFQGYAPGELEWLINTVSSHRVSEIHNEVFFKQGHANNGILNIKSDMTEEDIQAIKRMLQRQSAGVRNAHRQIVFAAANGIEWIPMSAMTNRDMEWYKWMVYLIRLICGVYGLNPAEINFDVAKDSTTSLGDGGTRNEVILKDTRNSILRPLLNWLQDIINDEIMPRYNKQYADKYILEFVGLDSQDEDVELDRIKKKVTTVYTLNEVRRQLGLQDLEYGDIILDSIYLQYLTLKQDGIGGEDGNPQGSFEENVDINESSEEEEQGFDLEEEEEKAEPFNLEVPEGSETFKSVIKSLTSTDKTKAEKQLNKLKRKPIKVEWYK